MDVGKVLENVVYIHLKICGYEVLIGKVGDKEIDFVGQKNGYKIYIQACYLIADEKVKQREFGNLSEIKDNYPKIVVYLDDYAPENIAGIKHMHLKEFLSKEDL